MTLREILAKHRRHVELSPGAGSDAQKYALAVIDDIEADCAQVFVSVTPEEQRIVHDELCIEHIKDAERYRWIRDNGVSVKAPGANPYPLVWALKKDGIDIIRQPELDVAVDCAIAEREPQNS